VTYDRSPVIIFISKGREMCTENLTSRSQYVVSQNVFDFMKVQRHFSYNLFSEREQNPMLEMLIIPCIRGLVCRVFLYVCDQETAKGRPKVHPGL
jgi:hypothetical protein